ncbi:histidine decarboxylase [Longispora sp. NPDC051575]|uniref:histidine decarboxylase n=1 Tax=Longispora sp. NPDC051575 TaxID=3154943 RepID=UPI00343D6972
MVGLDDPWSAQLEFLWHRLDLELRTLIGFPGARDVDWNLFRRWIMRPLNAFGDPDSDPRWANHAREYERQVVTWVGDLFRAPADRWGYVTSGGTEGIIAGLRLARAAHPGAVVYYSAAAHACVPDAAELLRMLAVPVDVDGGGEMDYGDLARKARAYPGRPAVVVATVGTTMTEATDNTHRIHAALNAAGVGDRYLHVDAALAGIPLALLDDGDRPAALDMTNSRVDSLSISGHKFLAVPMPCGVVIARRSHRDLIARPVVYTSTVSSTVLGSRCGHTILMLWWVLHRYGLDGHRLRAVLARDLASYLVDRLTESGHLAWRHPHSMTVVLRRPPAAIVQRWQLATAGEWSHVVTMPGVTRDVLDQFLEELRDADPTAVNRRAAA